MFSKTSAAVLAGMALAGSVLVAPAVVGAPTAGRAAAWGYNNSGQLGNNTTTDSSVAVAVKTDGVLAGKTITAIDSGDAHACAVADGKVYCWGWNAYGQLGNNSTTDSSVPVAVDTDGVLAGKSVTTITAGGRHSCAVAEGRAYCWGYNANGELGNNSTSGSRVPVAVNEPLASKTVTAITARGYHTCAVADGRAYCWGHNGYGQLGTGSTTPSKVAVAVNTVGVLAGKTVTAITAGNWHSCAVAEGRAYCWGYNANGELGNDSTTGSSLPVAVGEPLASKTVTEITAGVAHSCVLAEGRAFCWGSNGHGQLGNNSTTGSSVPVAVNADGVLAGTTVAAITAGGEHSCALADGRASCWGWNGSGQLGNNSTTNSSVPVAANADGVLAAKTVTAISAGEYHSCAVAAAVPQPPTSVSGVPGDGQVTVSWAAPADDGGSPVLDYVASAIPSGASCTATGTSCVVSGLANGTATTSS